MRAPDDLFADPMLAAHYDALDGQRDDLDAYVDLVLDLGANTAIDIGCGTGCLAIRLGELGLHVIGVDPAAASLQIARNKVGGQAVTWVHGDATALPDVQADIALMTGNVAQVFVEDIDWDKTLNAIRHRLKPGGWLVFESRRPEARDWEAWDVHELCVDSPATEDLSYSRRVTTVELPLVTFETVVRVNGESLHSLSTLRFRSELELRTDLDRNGFVVADVRQAPDRPGKEYVFVATVDG